MNIVTVALSASDFCVTSLRNKRATTRTRPHNDVCACDRRTSVAQLLSLTGLQNWKFCSISRVVFPGWNYIQSYTHTAYPIRSGWNYVESYIHTAYPTRGGWNSVESYIRTTYSTRGGWNSVESYILATQPDVLGEGV